MRGGTGLVEDLTPREWEVLALVREGLTNEQIAERLGISRDGVKYHVSEILGKLGVDDRIEAARWYDRETRQRAGVLGAFGGVFRRREASVTQTLAAGAIVVGAVAFVALLAGVLVMQSRDGGPAEVLPEDRSTGDERLDEVMTGLVFGDATVVRQNSAGAVAREYDSITSVETVYNADAWSAALASAASREVYAVMLPHPQSVPTRDFDVYLRVVDGAGVVQSWDFAIADYAIVDIRISQEEELSWLAGALGHQFDRFVVLPPAGDRPKPPPAHDLASADAGPEFAAIIDALHKQDPVAVLSLVAYSQQPCGSNTTPLCGARSEGTPVEALAVTDCNHLQRHESRAFVERRLTTIAGEAVGVAGILRLPEGYFPGGDTLVVVLGEESPYRWQFNGLVVKGGRITGLVDRCTPQLDFLYPPAAFTVLPPDTLDGLDADRRSGIDVIDAFLDGLAAADIEALAALTSYQRIGCVTEQLGIGAPPLCEPGEDEGTLVNVLPMAQCEGHYSREADFVAEVLPRLAEQNLGLYAVLDLGPATPGPEDFIRGRYQAVLYDADAPEFLRALAFAFDDAGLTLVRYGCGPPHPTDLYWHGRAPDWLLAPP